MRKSFPLDNPIQSALQLRRALSLVWQTAPKWTLINIALSVIQGVLPLAALYLMKRLLDALSGTLAASKPVDSFPTVIFWIILAGGIAILTSLARSISDFASETQSMQVTDAVANILHTQSIAVDLDYYENPHYFDTLHRAQIEAPYRPTRIVNGLIQVAQNGISLIGIIGLLVSFNSLLALVLLLAAIPGTLVRLFNSQRLYQFEEAQTEKDRLSWYYNSILTYAEFAKELRLFDLGLLFKTRYRDLRQQIRSGKLALSRRRVISEFLAQVLAIIALFGSLAWIAFQTVLGKVTLGDLVVYYLGFQNGLNFLQAVLHSLAGLYEDNLFLTNLYQFLDLKPKIKTPAKPQSVPQPMPCGITFNKVGFTYASRQQETLHNIDLSLAPGEVIALVGENGSGKTTLIKLLCQLYDPTQGSIRVEGVDLRDLDPIQWRRQISVAFQDYVHYDLTAQENIWLGDIEKPSDPVQIAESSQRCGADSVILNLPSGYDTMLGQWFDEGQELSGGEWQKIALARAFWRQAHILILDEPTSSLDPLAEAELFSNFRQLLKGRSGILISHRFSTVQMADRIYVMDQGSISECGTHTALLAQNGHYAQLYRAQASHYQDL